MYSVFFECAHSSNFLNILVYELAKYHMLPFMPNESNEGNEEAGCFKHNCCVYTSCCSFSVSYKLLMRLRQLNEDPISSSSFSLTVKKQENPKMENILKRRFVQAVCSLLTLVSNPSTILRKIRLHYTCFD